MRLDHVSYVASHDQISDVVNRIGSQIGTAFVDGGIHPKFGTRNFTAPLINGQYIEVVCPIDHPATESTPFGLAVRKKLVEGGGWFAWVISTKNMDTLENSFGRKAVTGVRRKPNGIELKWKQIGVMDTLDDYQLPYFVEWLSENHPSGDGEAISQISAITIAGDFLKISKMTTGDLESMSFNLDWVKPELNQNETGIIQVSFIVKNRTVVIV